MLTGISKNGSGGGGGAIDYLLLERVLDLERLDKVRRMELLIQLSEDDLRVTLEAIQDKDWFSAESAETMAYIEKHWARYEGPVWQVQPQVLDDGDTSETLSLVDCSHRKWKYTSGVISFDFDDKPTPEEMAAIRREFEDFMFAGKNRETFNILWVQHGDKGRAENHFLIPRLDLETGQDLNICQRGYIEDFRVWNTYICEKYGFRDPLKVQQPEFKFVRENKDREQIRATITKDVQDKIAAGTVRSREDVIAVLEGFGTKTREGKDSFSIKIEGFEKNFKFSGGPLLDGAINGNKKRFVRRPINDEALAAATDAMWEIWDARADRFDEIQQKSNYWKNNSPQFDTIAPPNIEVDPATEPQKVPLGPPEAQKVPLDRAGAYKSLLEPLRGNMVTDTTMRITATAIFAHDATFDIGPILTEHFAEITDPTDVRQVRAALETNFQKREAVFDEIENGAGLETAYEALSHLVSRLRPLDPTTPWSGVGGVESQLRKIWGAAGKAIISCVDRLASLIQSEKIAEIMSELNDPPPPQTETKRPDVTHPASSQSTPSGGLNM